MNAEKNAGFNYFSSDFPNTMQENFKGEEMRFSFQLCQITNTILKQVE